MLSPYWEVPPALSVTTKFCFNSSTISSYCTKAETAICEAAYKLPRANSELLCSRPEMMTWES
jgi:hypothetical protein